MILMKIQNFSNGRFQSTMVRIARSGIMDAQATNHVPSRPIGGSFAWTGADVLRRDDWICRLEAGDIAEIDAAIAATRQRGLAISAIERDDFPLGRLTLKLGALRAQIRSGL